MNISNNNSSSRLTALDFTRFFAMIMMMQGHVIYELASPNTIDYSTFGWSVWQFIRGLTAPTFLFISGAVHIFANKRLEDGSLGRNIVWKRIKIALMLMLIGYLLVFPAARVYDLQFVSEDTWITFFSVNILQLFSVSLLLLLTLFIITKNNKTLGYLSLILAFIIVFASPFVHKVHWFDYLPEFFAAYLSSEHGSLFPVFPFSAYLLFGASFGVWLQNIEREKRNDFLMKTCWKIGLPTIIIGYPMMMLFSKVSVPFIDVMRVNPGFFFIRIGLVLTIISLMTYLYNLTKPLGKYYSMFGKRAIYIYVIHLMLIYGSPISAGLAKYFRSQLSLEYSILAALFVIGATLAIVYLYEQVINQHKYPKLVFRYAVAAYLFYVFFI
ncbi:MAG TPA: heparan-alpha-glucosaminide N-acetyltransferase domain-containing protein [Candidatus Kapabacteria bacterium]|nr:heparan-alpha-glucosaminide N-acetyltransferase domain-containing protein [Candidatus Kapabacteria bacterium]HPU23211.1 heparan-alpha-glucosaminide N-acetyltransferase domain-containing protein [Candidatus Kapabacteria bacterium]